MRSTWQSPTAARPRASYSTPTAARKADSSGRRNTSMGEVDSMAWATDRSTQHTGRPAMRSPGRPAPPREVEQEFWRLIATGASSEDAATAVGVSAPVGSRWFRHGGGMPPMRLAEPTGRYLSFAEREELGLLKAQDHGVREIGRRMGRAASTISRELRRNAATRGGRFAVSYTHLRAHETDSYLVCRL